MFFRDLADVAVTYHHVTKTRRDRGDWMRTDVETSFYMKFNMTGISNFVQHVHPHLKLFHII